MLRITFRIGLNQIKQKINFYCTNQTTKEYYVRNAMEINKFNEPLSLIHDKLMNDMIHLQNASFSGKKLSTICW